MKRTLNTLNIDNSFVRDLPEDHEKSNQRRQVLGACFSRVNPEPVKAPKIISLSPEVLALLDLSADKLDRQSFAQVFSGNKLIEGMDPYASCYGGHQFGHWAGQLGDGRAITLCEVVNSKNNRWELQLKGAGPTPYSRMGDGRAVMRSSVREFLCSEAMHHLGVPSTRALSLVGTGDGIMRDMFYDGNQRMEPGAVVCRVAPTFVRFGNFEMFASRGDHELLKKLADYTISNHFSHLGAPSKQTYINWLKEICESTAKLMVHWMRVGFVHGVMNTDNMSILSQTIDYGPYGWLEGFDPTWTPNTTDASGRRYCYGNQPKIALWNLVRFANAIYPLVGETKPLEEALDVYIPTFSDHENRTFSQKLGLVEKPGTPDPLIGTLLELLTRTETDMTLFYRNLVDVPVEAGVSDADRLDPLMVAYYVPGEMTGAIKEETLAWLTRYTDRVREEGMDPELRKSQMNAANPKFVLRNYLAQLAIDEAEKGEGAKVDELLDVLRHPYDEQPGREIFAEKRPEWARNRPGCSMLSCSS